MEIKKKLMTGSLALTLILPGCAIAPGSKGLKLDAAAPTAALLERDDRQSLAPSGSGATPGDALAAPPPQPVSLAKNQAAVPTSGLAQSEEALVGAADGAVASPSKPDTEKPVEASPTPEATPTAEPTTEPTAVPENLTDFFFFSYDDSASTAGVELTKHALKNKFLPQTSWARPWEFLNYETFQKQNQQSTGLFKVSMGMWKHADVKEQARDVYELGVHVSAPDLEKASRKNVVLTLVVDVSGSMDESSVLVGDEGRAASLLEIAQFGMERMFDSLKEGDVLNLIQFSDSAETLLEGYQYNSGDNTYLNKVRNLATVGGTNLNAGIEEAYRIASQYRDPAKTNRVVMLTDAKANIGEVDPTLISEKTRINNQEGIYFSGLGFGQTFNEDFLNKLTEAGRGAYFSVITKQDASRAFKERFISLLNVAARNVQFRLDYPAILKRYQSAAEESSKIQSEVQPTNFSYNTSQYFWESFTGNSETNVTQQPMKLSIFYTNPDTGQKVTETYEKPISDMMGADLNNIKDAHLITLLTSLITEKTTKEQADLELKTLLGDYSSSIATEYKQFIETWKSLKK